MDNNFDKILDILDHYSESTGINLQIIDMEGNIIQSKENSCKKICSFLNDNYNNQSSCKQSLLHGAYQSERFGGKYVFFCKCGFVHFASPVYVDSIMQYSIIGGPLLMVNKEEFIKYDLSTKFNFDYS